MLVQQVKTLDDARRNLSIVLRLVQDGKLRVSESTKRPTVGTQKTLRTELAGSDFYSDEAIQTYAWPLLIQAAGLAKGVKLALTAKGSAALSADPDETLVELWRRWITHGLIDELSRCEAIKGQRSRNALSALSTRRLVAAEALIGLDKDFTDIDELPLCFTCARNGRAEFKFHVGHPEYDSLGYSESNFANRVDRRYLMALIFEYAATLGLVDVAYVRPEGARDDVDPEGSTDLVRLSRYDGLRMVRPTELVGRWLEATAK